MPKKKKIWNYMMTYVPRDVVKLQMDCVTLGYGVGTKNNKRESQKQREAHTILPQSIFLIAK